MKVVKKILLYILLVLGAVLTSIFMTLASPLAWLMNILDDDEIIGGKTGKGNENTFWEK